MTSTSTAVRQRQAPRGSDITEESELREDKSSTEGATLTRNAPRKTPWRVECGVVVAACLAFRLGNALCVVTFFNPDEYWQSLEVAHRMAFGYGHLTWEWAAGLRGYFHPSIFAGLYKLLQALHLDSAFMTSRSPKLLQGVFAAVCDLYVYLISRESFGLEAARLALLCQVLSWFNFYCLVRTYANSLEAVLMAASVYHLGLHTYPSHSESSRRGHHHHRRLGLLLAGACVVVRPACLPFWAAAGLHRLLILPSHRMRTALATDAAAAVAAVLGLSLALDRAFYGRWVFVAWEFARFNLFQGGSALYGSHPWHWNFSQGFPAIAASYLPLMAAGAEAAFSRSPKGSSTSTGSGGSSRNSSGGSWSWFIGTSAEQASAAQHDARGGGGGLVGVIRYATASLLGHALLYTVLMSLPAHKEFRFLLPALQLCIPVSGAGLFQLLLRQPRKPESSSNKHQGEGHSSGAGSKGSSSLNKHDKRRWRKAAAIICLALQIPAAIYLSTIHQRGPMAVMDVLASHAKALGGSSAAPPTSAMTVLFLMPCHSTPFHSHVHSASVSMAFLDCSPPGMEAAVRRLNCQMRHHHKGEEEEEASLSAPAGAHGGAAAAPSWTCSLPALSGAEFSADPDGTAARLLGGPQSDEDFENGRPGAAPPSHVVMFGAAAQALDPVLRGFGYRESERVFNTHVALDEAQAGDSIVVYTQQESLSDD